MNVRLVRKQLLILGDRGSAGSLEITTRQVEKSRRSYFGFPKQTLSSPLYTMAVKVRISRDVIRPLFGEGDVVTWI